VCLLGFACAFRARISRIPRPVRTPEAFSAHSAEIGKLAILPSCIIPAMREITMLRDCMLPDFTHDDDSADMLQLAEIKKVISLPTP
jgi:hypothetical protein